MLLRSFTAFLSSGCRGKLKAVAAGEEEVPGTPFKPQSGAAARAAAVGASVPHCPSHARAYSAYCCLA
jgi:hypothetical protein